MDGNKQSRLLSTHLQVLEQKEAPRTAFGTALWWGDQKLSKSAKEAPGFQGDKCITHMSNYSWRIMRVCFSIYLCFAYWKGLKLPMRAVSTKSIGRRVGNSLPPLRWPQHEISACLGHVRVWLFVGPTGRASSFEMFLQGQYFVHSYLLSYTQLLLWSTTTVEQGETCSLWLQGTVTLTGPHRTVLVTGASSVTKPHVSCLELSGPG